MKFVLISRGVKNGSVSQGAPKMVLFAALNPPSAIDGTDDRLSMYSYFGNNRRNYVTKVEINTHEYSVETSKITVGPVQTEDVAIHNRFTVSFLETPNMNSEILNLRLCTPGLFLF